MIKIYEAIKQNSARLVTTWCNIHVTLNFVNGNVYQGKGAQLVTNDKFIQDAVENDPRFGVTIILRKVVKEEGDEAVVVKAKDNKPSDTAPKQDKKKKSTKAAATENNNVGDVVESVKTLNDAIDYFAERGELLESADGVSELCSKYGVSFPNLNM